MGHTLLLDGWNITETASQTSGTKVYKDGGSDTLPSIGDEFDATYDYVVCTSISKTPYFVDLTDTCDNGYKYTCQYSSVVAPSYSLVPGDDENNQKFTVGGEIVSVEPTDTANQWFWATNVGVAGTDPITGQKIYVSNPVGLITFTRIIDFADLTAFKIELMAAAGKLNDATWEGFGEGNVLFLGADGQLYKDSGGSYAWKFELSFKWRSLGGLYTAAPTTHTWQYLWRNDYKGWQIPACGTGFEFNLYEYYDFNSLLS